MTAPIKIAVAGTHSTGKSTFLDELERRLADLNLKIGRIYDLARGARELGFPILTEHTYESTLWIMAEALRQEAELSLTCDVILVDRPLFDAFGYLVAALRHTDRSLDPREIEELMNMAQSHAYSYDMLICTILDPSVSLGEGRDRNLAFRQEAAVAILELVENWSLDHLKLTLANRNAQLDQTYNFITSRS